MLGKKSINCLLIVFVLIICSLTGCINSEVSNSKGAKKALNKVTITYAAGKDATRATTLAITAFEKKYPYINVKYKELPTQTDVQHNTYFTALSAGDDSIDVLALDIVWTTEFAAAGWLLNLDKKFTPQIRKNYLQGPIDAVTYNRKFWAVPRYTDAGILYYRKDIISKPPKTWEELIEMSKKNVGRGGTKYGIVFQGLQYEGLVCDALEFIGSNGGQVLSGDKVVINSPKAIKGFKYMLDLINEHIAPQEVTTYQEEDARNVFQTGQAIFMRNWPYAWALTNKSDSPIKGKVGIAPIPIGRDGSKRISILGGWNLGINKYSTHPEEAWKFVQFLAGYEGQKITALEGGNLPSIKALYSDAEVLARNPYWKQFYNLFVSAIPRPVTPSYPKLTEIMQMNFHKALTENISAKTTLANIQKEMNKVINEKDKP